MAWMGWSATAALAAVAACGGSATTVGGDAGPSQGEGAVSSSSSSSGSSSGSGSGGSVPDASALSDAANSPDVGSGVGGDAEGGADTVGLDDGLIAHYLWNASLLDQTVNHVDGTANGGIAFGPDRCGNAAAALLLNGTDAEVSLGASLMLKPTDVISISTWMSASTFAPTYQNLISDHGPNEPSVGYAYILRLSGANLQFIEGGVYGSGNATFAGTSLLGTTGTWQHVVAVYDGAALTIWVDGVRQANTAFSGALTQNGNPVLVGASGYGEYFSGSLDDTRIYHRALDAVTIQRLYAAGPCSGL